MQHAAQDDARFQSTATMTATAASRTPSTPAPRAAEPRAADDRVGTPTATACVERDVHFDLARTTAALGDALERALRPHGLTGAQYNVLRILRDADPAGLCRNALRERLPTRMPDVTRLLDRMEAAGLVTRERSPLDRRLVTTCITARGRRMADELDAAVRDEHRRRLGHLGDTQLRALADLLAQVRGGIEPVAPRARR